MVCWIDGPGAVNCPKQALLTRNTRSNITVKILNTKERLSLCTILLVLH